MLTKLKEDIELSNLRENIVCFLIYGSFLEQKNNEPNDLDGILIVKDLTHNFKELFDLLKNKYKKLDINIYTYQEVIEDLSFYTREFKLEYLAKGQCVIGENIFTKEYKKVTLYQYKRSILIRSIEHLQMVRQKYLYEVNDEKQSKKYLLKYFERISRNILLFLGEGDHTSVNAINYDKIAQKLIDLGFLNNIPKVETMDSKNLFDEFQNLSRILLHLRIMIEN